MTDNVTGATSAISRPHLFACLTILLLINALAPMAFQDIALRGIVVSAVNFFGISVVFAVAGYAIWAIALKASADEPITDPVRRTDWAVALVVLAVAIIPIHLAAKAMLVPLAAYMLATARRDEAVFRVGFIAAALTGALVWGALLLTAFAKPILAIDAVIVQTLTGVPVDGNVLSIGQRPGLAFDKIIILGACSSLRNISQAAILWASLVQLFEVRVTPRVVAFGLLAMASTILVNAIRISLIVAYPQHLQFFHDGIGSSLLGLVALVAAFAIIGVAILRREPHATA